MKQDVSAYYTQTQNHYQRWWQLTKGMALHYGLWYKKTSNFLEALDNTNRYLADLAEIKNGQKILDAGCGVGGSAIFLAKNYRVSITGISLSELQIKTAQNNSEKHNVGHQTEYKVIDFCNTKLRSNSFDVIWACESSSHAADKKLMAKEWFRLLKPGGRLVLTDFFKVENSQNDKDKLLDKWASTWAMSPLVTVSYLRQCLENEGFIMSKDNDITEYIIKTARRMYLSYWLGLLPSVLYNIIIGARHYAKNHYKSGYYQYIALRRNLWEYNSILLIKPHARQ